MLTSRAFAAEGVDFFEAKVRPLLIEKCYECHAQGKKIKGGLRLDHRDGWAKGGDTGPAIVPGKPEESLLIEAVRYTNRDLEMPPKNRLSQAEVQVLEEWVKLGAPDPRTAAPVAQSGAKGAGELWSMKPLKAPAIPAVEAQAPIDRFILASLRQKGLTLSPRADGATLLRRASYALTGLPPSVEQLQAFEQSSSPAAFEKLVDELLASPHFGEQWGRHWLDVARFAESSGGGRTLPFKDAWRYRDYVIESFNADMPFDQFIREQLAGDLLPHENAEQQRRQLVATGFLALGPTNYEEQDKQALRMDIVDEQLDTMGKGFLGMTIGCARCHDHKFDPIPQKDYYALAGIFRSTQTLKNYTDNVAHWVDVSLPLPAEQEALLAQHEARVAKMKAELAEAKKAAAKFTVKNTAPTSRRGQPIAPEDLPGVVVDDTAAKRVGEWILSQYSKSYIGEGALHDQNEGKGEKTLTFVPELPKSGRYEVRLAYIHAENRSTKTPVTIFHADGEELVRVNEKEAPPVDGRFVSLGQFRFEKGGAGYVLVSNEGTDGLVSADAVQFLPAEEVTADAPTPDDPGAAEAVKLVKKLEAELKKTVADGAPRPQAMSVTEGEIGDAAIAIRGNIRNLGDQVPRGFLSAASWEPAKILPAEASGRRELAEWVASPKNPLTARVIANRVWHWLFGVGLVRTTDNFGVMGETPSHPELLDYLATRLIAEHWSIKRLVREIVLSGTWQQSSAHREEAAKLDPDDHLYWRMPRRRMDAEELRDTILIVSGQLDRRFGGPGIVGSDGAPVDPNTTASQNLEYGYKYPDVRRSVYTPAFRNNRLELFSTFDWADPNMVTGKRNVSTVAPQALYLLNHPFVIEQARLAAKATEGVGDTERIECAFQAAYSRPPDEKERRLALDFVSTGDDAQRRAAWEQFYQMLFASVDFRYIY